MQILLVESDPARTQELTSVFTDLNYEVLHLESQKGAKEACQSHPVRLVLASVDGEAKGFDLCTALRKEKKTQSLPMVLMSGAAEGEQQCKKYKATGGKVDGFILQPAPCEDVVEQVERLIGLPEPPDTWGGPELSFPGSESLSGAQGADVVELRREVESLHEQINFYQKQLEQVSVSGEKESHEMDNLLHELQEDLEKEQKAKAALQDELTLLKADLSKMDQEAKESQGKVQRVQEDLKKETERLKAEMEALRATYNESNEKHKKAQAALREYYKPKISKVKNLQKTIEGLEERLANYADQVKKHKAHEDDLQNELKTLQKEIETLREASSEAEELKKEVEELREEVLAERDKSKKAKEALKNLKDVFE